MEIKADRPTDKTHTERQTTRHRHRQTSRQTSKHMISSRHRVKSGEQEDEVIK